MSVLGCLSRAFKARGLEAEFRATGQTGILIAGSGIPIDAVVSDFIAGAAEMLTPAAGDERWDLVEGQDSIFHPSYAGVSLGLLHGTQPDVIVLCHELGRDKVVGFDNYLTPSLEEAIDLLLMLARRTNPAVRCAGIALNIAKLDARAAGTCLGEHAGRLHLPAADQLRPGPELEETVTTCLENEGDK